jgi:hypothetical protein
MPSGAYQTGSRFLQGLDLLLQGQDSAGLPLEGLPDDLTALLLLSNPSVQCLGLFLEKVVEALELLLSLNPEYQIVDLIHGHSSMCDAGSEIGRAM